MSGRKENLKRSLGITEYPWSSDDEETDSQQPQEVQLARRQTGDTRSSAADMPGPSGLQPPPASPAAARKHQTRMERNLFWSILNNTPKPSSIGTLRCSTRGRALPTLAELRESSSNPGTSQRERTDRATTADIQGILAFKNLTRSLDRLSQDKPSSCLYSMSSRGNSGPSRSPLFTPGATSDLALTSAAASARAGRAHANSYRRQTARRGHTTTYPYRTNNEPQPSSSGVSRPRRADSFDLNFRPPVPERRRIHVSLDHSDEEAVELTDPVVEPIDEGNIAAGNSEVLVLNSSADGVSLEEEIVEVVPPDEPDAADPPAPAATAAAPADVTIDIGEACPNPDASPILENTENPDASPSQHGVKRKRDVNEEKTEPLSSVKEFNQTLLRLLECPVCLEWMEPPMSQCRRGHLVCGRCRARLASCPVCRTGFSSVRNRAMEGVAEMLRYPCRHACGREVRLRRRAAHEASCAARRYPCPAPACAAAHPLQRQHLADHFQSKHLSILKIGGKHKFSMKVNSEQHDTWLVMALDEFFSLRVEVDIRTWGVDVYVTFIGPKCNAKSYVYEVTVEGQHSARKIAYARTVHSDLESPSLNVSRQDCFHLTLDQALNFLRFKNRHCETDKFLDFNVEITKCETNDASIEDSES